VRAAVPERALRFFRVASGAMAAVFVAFAALQHNDPDAALWITAYALAALASLDACRAAARAWPALAVGFAALGWAGVHAAELARTGWPDSIAAAMKAESPAVELAREMLGLAIVAAWMTVVAAVRRRRG
jgi:hypothetical protein